MDKSAQVIREFEQRLANASEHAQRNALTFAKTSLVKAIGYLKLCEAGRRYRTVVLVDPHYDLRSPIG